MLLFWPWGDYEGEGWIERPGTGRNTNDRNGRMPVLELMDKATSLAKKAKTCKWERILDTEKSLLVFLQASAVDGGWPDTVYW